MFLKKHSLFASYNSLHHCSCPQSTTSSPTTRTRPSTPRSYATVAPSDGSGGGSSSSSNSNPSSDQPPHTWPSTESPSPYDVLGCSRSASYSKFYFTRLVKIYHPDRNIHASTTSNPSRVTQSTALERYRLIVAAHALLSDPTKRSAYDRWGFGWNGVPSATPSPWDQSGAHGGRRASSQSYYGGHASSSSSSSSSNSGGSGGFYDASNPFANATWEDWERYYQRQNGNEKAESQTPLFLSNGAFVSLIVMMAALGGVGQATRAENASLSFLEQRDARHDEASKMLRQVRKEAAVGKQERIKQFLIERDPAFADEAVRRLVMEPEVCDSEGVERKVRKM